MVGTDGSLFQMGVMEGLQMTALLGKRQMAKPPPRIAAGNGVALYL